MKTKRHEPVADYNFTCNDKLFLDANIWLYMYGPQSPEDRYVSIYSEAFDRMLKAESKLYTDVLVVSEFINRYARQKNNRAAPSIKFKDFRKSHDFKIVASAISAAVRSILELCSLLESGFSSLDVDCLLDEYAEGDSDFNDQVIAELCKTNGLTLITNDSDFKNQTIPVLSANPKVFSW